MVKKRLTVSGEERNGGTVGTSTTSTTNSVNVILRVVGVVIVQHMSDVTDIFAKESTMVSINHGQYSIKSFRRGTRERAVLSKSSMGYGTAASFNPVLRARANPRGGARAIRFHDTNMACNQLGPRVREPWEKRKSNQIVEVDFFLRARTACNEVRRYEG